MIRSEDDEEESLLERDGTVGYRYQAFTSLKAKVSEKINEKSRSMKLGQLVQRANYLITTVLEDSYEFISTCLLTTFNESSLICDCMVTPENFKFDPNSKQAMDQVSFKVDLMALMIDPDSISVNEALKDIQYHVVDDEKDAQIRERIKDELVDL